MNELEQTTLLIPPAVRRQLSRWAREEYPCEACGLLLGSAGERGGEVVHASRARNAAGDPRRSYLLAPEDFVSAWREAARSDLEILGIWHSHPDGAAEPSETDQQNAWNGYAYLILGVSAQGVTDLRSWRLAGDGFEEEPLTA